MMYEGQQLIQQLEKRKGGYFHLKIDASVVEGFSNGKRTRLICSLEDRLEFQCGLNHYGDGNFFIILNTKNVQKLGKSLGDPISFSLSEDPNPLGVEIPEVLLHLLDQDDFLKKRYESLTDGKKRSIIHQINRIKDIDKQINKAVELIDIAHSKSR